MKAVGVWLILYEDQVYSSSQLCSVLDQHYDTHNRDSVSITFFTYIDCDWSCNCTEFGNALTVVLAISTAVVDVVHIPKATTSSTDWLPLALTKQQHGMISPSIPNSSLAKRRFKVTWHGLGPSCCHRYIFLFNVAGSHTTSTH